MAKVHFYYSAMNAGKSTTLLQSSYNYLERGLKTLLFIPEIDDRVAKGVIASRIGIQEQAKSFSRKFNFIKFLELQTTMPNCLLIDEAQFLTKQQVKELCYIADQKNIPSLVNIIDLRNVWLKYFPTKPLDPFMYNEYVSE